MSKRLTAMNENHRLRCLSDGPAAKAAKRAAEELVPLPHDARHANAHAGVAHGSGYRRD
jgi:hypothetical protein